MDQNLAACAAFTFEMEGGYSGSSLDPGNWSSGIADVGRLIGTNDGISAPTLIDWVGRGKASIVTAAYMKALPKATAQAIFTARYWNVLRGSSLPSGVDVMMVDFGFNAGDSESATLTQIAVDVDDDGVVGPETLAAIQGTNTVDLIAELAVAQAARYRQTLNFALYGSEWLARTDARTALALRTAAGGAGLARPMLATLGIPMPRPIFIPRAEKKDKIKL